MRLAPPFAVEVGCLDCLALDNDVKITLGNVPVEVIYCISNDRVALTCLNVYLVVADCIHIPDADCLFNVVVGLFFLG